MESMTQKVMGKYKFNLKLGSTQNMEKIQKLYKNSQRIYKSTDRNLSTQNYEISNGRTNRLNIMTKRRLNKNNEKIMQYKTEEHN